MTTSNKKLAVLIDADNAPADSIDEMLEEIAKYGVASVKRIYGDWSHGLSKWKAALLPHAIIPVQQFAYTKGKNATDMALVIDAMDLLYSGNFDGFCIVSSDSDFTRLASRIRESGLTVYGFGEKKTPESFRRACDKFIYIEIFRPEKNQASKQKDKQPTQNPSENNKNQAMVQLIKRAVKENADDLGWANLGPIGSYINKINPDFDSRLFGFGKLSDLIKSLDLFEHRTDNNQLQVRRRAKNDNGNGKSESKAEIKTEPKPESKTQPEPKNQSKAEPKSEPQNHPKIEPKPEPKNQSKAEPKSKNQPKIDPKAEPNNQPKTKPQPETPTTTEPTTDTPKTKKRGRKPSAKQTPSVQIETVETAPVEPSKPEKAPTKISFTKVIPIVQNAIDQFADNKGWARLMNVLKHLEMEISVQQYGFENARDLVHAIYSDWIEIQKIGRGERIRVNKRFVVKE